MKVTHHSTNYFQRTILVEIDSDLGAVDVERLKFLTKDHLPHGGLTKSSRGIDVFSTLEQRGKLKPTDSTYIQVGVMVVYWY